MTHYVADGDAVLQFTSKASALRYLLKPRVRPRTAAAPNPGLDWSAPPASTDANFAAASEGQSPSEVRTP